MIALWQLQDAKNKFSEVVEKALKNGPQIITRRGIETVVIISIEDYQKLTRPKVDMVDFFRKSPLRGVDLDLTRDMGFGREVDF
jgi:prevent-host-death family protein